MTTDQREQLEYGSVAPLRSHDGLTIDVAALWGTTRRLCVQRSGETLFACSVTSRPPFWFITECLPQRRDRELASMLLNVCEYLAVEHGAAEIIAIHPAFWEERLAAGGASPLQRIVPMWLPLDDDLLLMHTRPLPGPYQVAPLDLSVDKPLTLAQLSTETDREGDLKVWREIFAGAYGPIIGEATQKMVERSTLRAAAVITEYLGSPLLAHCVTATTDRGKGLGRALLVECLKELSKSGYVDCHLNVVEENWVARRLYRSIGFIQNRPTLRASYLSGSERGRLTNGAPGRSQ